MATSSRALSATTITQHLPQKHRYVRRGWQPNPARCAPIAPISPSSGLPLTNLPYFVRRTAGNQLPVYTDTKAGGTLQQTKIQKIEGSLEALRDQLAQELGINAKDGITINHLTGHVIVKVRASPSTSRRCARETMADMSDFQGWKRPQITKFLLERGF
ncbi:hypothetical protein KEM52_006470 [Ascosphaera acerosa]|nr:hypothetical protein KEM52_006470 [Ascosphaera acerosa]